MPKKVTGVFRFTGRVRLALLTVMLLLAAQSASASFIVAPHTAGRDAQLSGNTVASPEDPSSTQYVNPAGIVGKTGSRKMFAVAALGFSAKYSNPSTGYQSTSSQTPVLLNFWYGLGQWGGWSAGVGLYGSVGTAFSFANDLNIGQTARYTGKLTIVNFGFNVGRAITRNLSIGFEIAPRYGRQMLSTPTPVGDVRFSIDGLGLVGSLGVLYKPTDKLSLGLTYNLPGFVDMKGHGTVAGNYGPVKLMLITPQSVTAGAAYWWDSNTQFMVQMKWTNYTQFEHGQVKIENTPVLNQPFIAHAKNRIRWGFGIDHQVVPGSWLRVGFSFEKWMIESSSLRPYLFDNSDVMVMAGYEIKYPSWSLGFTLGWAGIFNRTASPSVNAVAPGEYGASADVMGGIAISW